MQKFLFLLFIFFTACSEKSSYFSLQVREDSLANITQATPFTCNDISSALLGFEVQKIHSVKPTENQAIIVVRKNAQNVAYIYPDKANEKIAFLEIVHPNVKTRQGVHVGMLFKDIQKKIILTCKESLTCKSSSSSNLTYHFNKDKRLEYIVLILK